VNFLLKSNLPIKIEIYYRTAHMLFDGTAFHNMLQLIFPQAQAGKPVDHDALRQNFVDLQARSSRSVQAYIQEFLDREHTIWFKLKYMPLFCLNKSNGDRISFVSMTKLPSGIDIKSVPQEWVVMDARTDVGQKKETEVPSHPDVLRPSLSVHGIYLPEHKWLVPARDQPFGSPITIGYSYLAYGLANDWEFKFDAATANLLDTAFYAWLVVAKQYLPETMLHEKPPTVCEMCTIMRYFFSRNLFLK